MSLKIKINFKDLRKWKKFSKRVFDFFVENAFILFLLLFVFDFVAGALIFYQYAFPRQKIIEASKPFKLEKEILENALKENEERGKRFSEIETKTYPNLFKTSVVQPELPQELPSEGGVD
jgi:hypothetical protein